MQTDLLNELHASEARFRAAFQSSAIGMGLLSLDGKILQVNDAIVKMSGYSEEELLQRYDSDNVLPEDREVGMDLYRELLDGKRDWYQVEKRYVRKNGEVFWTRLTLSAVRNPDKSPIYLVGMIEDIDQQKRTLASLRESEERFRVIFDNAGVGIALVGMDRRPLAANARMIEMTGYSSEEFFQKSGLELGHPEDAEIGIPELQGVLAGKLNSYQIEKRYVRRNGQVYWVRLTNSVVRAPDGAPHYFVTMVEDINEQKEALEELHKSQSRFQAIFDDAAVGMGVLSLDRRLIEANAALCRTFGRTREELMGMNATDVTYPDDNPASKQLFIELVEGKRDSYEVDRRYVRKNGEIFWAHTTMSAVRGLDGRPQYIVGMIEDIDEQKKMQERIRESEARFRALYDNVSIGMAMVSLDRHIINVNQVATRMTGYDADELLGRDPSFLSHPEDIQIGMEQFREMVAGNIPSFQMQKRFIRKDGSFFWGRVTYSLVPDKDGRPLHLAGFIEDATEEIVAQERLAEQEADYLRTLQQKVQERTRELEETNRKLQQEIEQRIRIEQELARKAAEEAVTADRTRLARDLHDAVTQTLFSASLTAEVLPELWEMDAEEARRSTEELRQLTRGALAEMRTLLLELRPAALTQTRLSDLIRQLCEAFIGRSRLPITLTVEGERDLPPEVQVACYRVAQEGLNNVFKYARASKVDVNLFLSPVGLRFEVCDNGIGFDMTASKPTSLGMRIMRERAEAIGAELHVSSSPGSGTCVELAWNENPNVKLRVL